jgi:hypothetical protein
MSGRSGQPLPKCEALKRSGEPCECVIVKGSRLCRHHSLQLSGDLAYAWAEGHKPVRTQTIAVPVLGKPLTDFDPEELYGLALYLRETQPLITAKLVTVA